MLLMIKTIIFGRFNWNEKKSYVSQLKRVLHELNCQSTVGSMDKVKPDTNKLKNWLKKYNGPYVISDKLDGISNGSL